MLKLVRRLNMSIKLYNTKKGLTMMNFIEIAKKRYSVRNYSSKKVEKEKLDKILQAAHVAPTAANLQPVHLIAVESKEAKRDWKKSAKGQIFIMLLLQLLYVQIITKHGFAHLTKNKPETLTQLS